MNGVTVHQGENLAGVQGWYWCERTRTGWDDGKIVYLAGRSGMGPFPTEALAAANAKVVLCDDHHPAFGLF